MWSYFHTALNTVTHKAKAWTVSFFHQETNKAFPTETYSLRELDLPLHTLLLGSVSAHAKGPFPPRIRGKDQPGNALLQQTRPGGIAAQGASLALLLVGFYGGCFLHLRCGSARHPSPFHGESPRKSSQQRDCFGVPAGTRGADIAACAEPGREGGRAS